MAKLHFDTDYMRGAHPLIMEKLFKTNLEQTPGYGTDEYTERAKKLIREECGSPEARIFFMVGGTQTNATVIDGILRHHQGVIAADSGHINVHESGAIEATGHKVLTLPGHDGKIDPNELEKYFTDFYNDDTYEHMVEPGLVYISYPTEFGTLYSLKELKALKRICKKFNAPLYLDGARLGYGLAANPDINLKVLSEICDVFYIGGTKVGALFGEAVVIPKGKLIPRSIPLIKQHGALLAKGRLLGIQFETLFTDGLYTKIAENAITRATELKEGFIKRGFRTFIDSPTNQQFFNLPNKVIDRLMETASFEYWGPRGRESSTVRFVTDWATEKTDIETLLSQIDQIS